MRLPRFVYFLPAIIALGWFGWWVWGTPAEKQMLAAQAEFLTALEDRDWDEVKGLLATTYTDAMGHTRETAVEDAQQILSQFISITLQTQNLHFQTQKDQGQTAIQIRMDGQGLGFGPMVMARVNAMQEPWQFHWHKEGLWPWTWRILRIHHPELHPIQLP
ncbi:hypothetical protein [Prosthecobacter dejongeii]|uniref:SnoaL-like domain-containing protein n=1 Tax=Prosthecobacter dejongeii TaxID=48465 RepID=A0A7W7YJJ7_9BACT|nr:hypothetical protein [Prosthecobacter dejongeii]MBB5037331.1 hypothetical protein [Prosthecobacter dejongeii]